MSESFVVSFEETFLLLPIKHQQIWKVIWWYSDKFKNCFPSHKTIATHAKCCIRTVRYALANFKAIGWITTVKRCYRSCLYYIIDKLKKLNPKNQKIFENDKKSCESYEHGEGGVFRDKLQHDLQHSRGTQVLLATERCNVHQIKTKKYQNHLKIRPHLQKYPFTYEDKIMIQKKFTESEIALAAESFDSYNKPKQKPIALFWWLCDESRKLFRKGF